jgi:hypothetical protein
MKSGSWEFLLFDENIPTVYGFEADMALLRFRKRVEEFRKRTNEVNNEQEEDKCNECTTSYSNANYTTAASPV